MVKCWRKCVETGMIWKCTMFGIYKFKNFYVIGSDYA